MRGFTVSQYDFEETGDPAELSDIHDISFNSEFEDVSSASEDETDSNASRLISFVAPSSVRISKRDSAYYPYTSKAHAEVHIFYRAQKNVIKKALMGSILRLICNFLDDKVKSSDLPTMNEPLPMTSAFRAQKFIVDEILRASHSMCAVADVWLRDVLVLKHGHSTDYALFYGCELQSGPSGKDEVVRAIVLRSSGAIGREISSTLSMEYGFTAINSTTVIFLQGLEISEVYHPASFKSMSTSGLTGSHEVFSFTFAGKLRNDNFNRSANKFITIGPKMNGSTMLESFKKDLVELERSIKAFNPETKTIQLARAGVCQGLRDNVEVGEMMSHSSNSLYPCRVFDLYCPRQAGSWEDVAYPGNLSNVKDTRACVNNREKGVKPPLTCVYSLPGFDPHVDFPYELLHGIYLRITRHSINLTIDHSIIKHDIEDIALRPMAVDKNGLT
ncbi:hypothetical protein K470DRAFT_265922 [Piedraia hortae CBS 480.64]|uniref:Uncharacterized protein n=1 Tax=Piedraia hortae CBS 480.64 TaxID=1314780 RepID=A0A6A7BV86_9PEZI|nr:hypothetical protein K470DRAFT_265922 [Piedraia hortae CBS 480.64]